jgi:signal peptidase I
MFMKFVKDWIIPILIALVITILINKLVFFNIQVPTSSMYPTIKEGDRITVLRIHDLSKLKHGDIVVFHSDELKETLVKRLIGLPGDTIEIREGEQVYVNGIVFKQDFTYSVDDYTGTFTVPEGCYFFMGDNRAGSYDSRKWANPYISADDIMGRAAIRIFPFNRFGKL